MGMIPFGRPARGGNETEYVLDAVSHDRYSGGKYVAQFENSTARYLGVKHAIAVNSGTSALHLALLAVGVGPGDEVIVPALTFASTAFAVSYCGATPVIVDVEANTWCLNALAVDMAITPKTKAIITVHLYGALPTVSLVPPGHITVIEDACEAWGTSGVGQFGDMACFSLQGSKTIQCGEGGIVATFAPRLADKIRHLRGQGMTDKRYWHDTIGYNYRMTELQGAVACAQLEGINRFVERRQAIMKMYRAYLPELTFQANDGCWSAACLLPDDIDRDTVLGTMLLRGVECRPVFYPLNQLPIHGWTWEPTPVAKRIAAHGIVLPTYPDLTDEAVQFVSRTLMEVVRDCRYAESFSERQREKLVASSKALNRQTGG